MIDAYAMTLEQVRHNVNNSLELGVGWFRTNNPFAISDEDEQALAVYGALLRHHRHDLVAVSANLANLATWFPLLSNWPQMKAVEKSIFGEYDTNLDVVGFMKLVEKELDGIELNGRDMYQLVQAMQWWNVTMTKWFMGVMFESQFGNDEEE